MALRKWRNSSLVTLLAIGTGITLFPFLSHDLYLYRANADIVAQHSVSPYVETPQDVLGKPATHGVHWAHQHTAYGPIALWIDALIAGGLDNETLALYFLRAAHWAPWIAMSIAALFIATSTPLLREKHVHLALLLTITNPLVLLEIGGMGHLEGVLVPSLIAALLCLRKGMWLGASLLLAAASLVKVDALILLPLFLASITRQPRAGIAKGVFGLLIVVAVIFLAYEAAGGVIPGMTAAFGEATKVERSAALLLSILPGLSIQGAAHALRLFLAVVILHQSLLVWRGKDAILASAVVWFAFVLLRPFFQPWYVCPLIALAALCPPGHWFHALAKTSTVSAVIGAYTYIFLARTLTPQHQMISAAVALIPMLVVAFLSARKRGALYCMCLRRKE